MVEQDYWKERCDREVPYVEKYRNEKERWQQIAGFVIFISVILFMLLFVVALSSGAGEPNNIPIDKCMEITKDYVKSMCVK